MITLFSLTSSLWWNYFNSYLNGLFNIIATWFVDIVFKAHDIVFKAHGYNIQCMLMHRKECSLIFVTCLLIACCPVKIYTSIFCRFSQTM